MLSGETLVGAAELAAPVRHDLTTSSELGSDGRARRYRSASGHRSGQDHRQDASVATSADHEGIGAIGKARALV
jgi:hypothetical protein